MEGGGGMNTTMDLTLTEADLMNLQQAGVLVTNQPTSHFSQNDLDTLASIQDDLETFNINSHSQEEIADMAALGKEMEGFMQGQINMSDEQLPAYNMDINMTSTISSSNQNTTTSSESGQSRSRETTYSLLNVPTESSSSSTSASALVASTSSPVKLEPGVAVDGSQKSIQIIKSGTGFSKLKLTKPGTSGGVQQIRIQSASAKPVSGITSISMSQPSSVKLVDMVPNKSKPVQGQVLNIVNSDGSISTVNVVAPQSDNTVQQALVQTPVFPTAPPSMQLQGAQTVQLVNSSGQKIGSAVRMINPLAQPVTGNQVQISAGGKFTLPGSQVIQMSSPVAAPVQPKTVLPAPAPTNQGIKVIGAGGQAFRIMPDGKLIADTSKPGEVQQIVQPAAAPVQSQTTTINTTGQFRTITPEQGQLFRTSDKKLIAFTGDKNVVLSSPNTEDAPEKGPQIIQLSSDDLKSLQKGPNRIQFVKVVNSSGQTQTVPIQMTKPKMPSPVKLSNSGEAASHLDLAIREIQQNKRDQQQAESVPSVRVKKPCNCTKSMCLKLYCDCFAVGEFCSDCNCTNCHNNLQFEEERQRSIRQCLDRNPNAFRPKIGKNPSQKDRRHNKGCNCKRSGCLKNYCECFEAKIICTDICKCVGCKNVDSRTGTKVTSFNFVEQVSEETLNVSEKHFKPTTSLRSKLLQAAPTLNLESATSTKKQPFGFLTQEVVEATCQCLLAQAEEGEKEGLSEDAIERNVIQEFGRCLGQIIDFSSKSKP